MSIDSNVRSRVWKFTHTLHTPLEQHATRVSAATNVEPYDALKQLFQSLILSTRLPSNAKVIQLRVTPEKALMCLSPMQEQTTRCQTFHLTDIFNPAKTNLIEIVSSHGLTPRGSESMAN